MFVALITTVVNVLVSLTQAKILYAGINEVLPVSWFLKRYLLFVVSLEVNLEFSASKVKVFQGVLAKILNLLTKYARVTFCLTCLSIIFQSTVDIFVDQEKINFFRVTFLMERMCPLSFGLGSKFNETVSD